MKQNQTNIKHEASQNSGLLNSSCFDRDMGKYSNCVWLLFGINILLHIYLAGRGFGASDTLMMLRAAYAAGEHFSISSFAHLSIQFEFVWIERFKDTTELRLCMFRWECSRRRMRQRVYIWTSTGITTSHGKMLASILQIQARRAARSVWYVASNTDNTVIFLASGWSHVRVWTNTLDGVFTGVCATRFCVPRWLSFWKHFGHCPFGIIRQHQRLDSVALQ